MRELWHPPTEEIELAQVMHALADPARLAIVAQLAKADKASCSAAGSGLELHKSTMSHHYRVLREAGVTLVSTDGRARIIRLRRADLDARFPGLLDAVLRALDSTPAKSPSTDDAHSSSP